jgi:hypothetical protein
LQRCSKDLAGKTGAAVGLEFFPFLFLLYLTYFLRSKSALGRKGKVTALRVFFTCFLMKSCLSSISLDELVCIKNNYIYYEQKKKKSFRMDAGMVRISDCGDFGVFVSSKAKQKFANYMLRDGFRFGQYPA